MSKLEYVKCICCGTEEDEEFIEAFNVHGNKLISEERFRLVKCRNCGLVYVNPRPIQSEIGRYYTTNYYATGRTIKSTLENWISRYCIARKKSLLFSDKRKGKILDIGCGDGNFISSFAMDTNWETYGIEPNKTGYNLSSAKLNAHILNAELSECKFPDAYFDVITMWHVLEHIYEPNTLLQEIYRILADDGILAIGIPNMKGIGFRISRANWFHLDVPRHVYFYNRFTVERILDKNGFKISRIEYPIVEYPLDIYHSVMNSIRNKIIRLSFVVPILALSLLLKPIFSFIGTAETITLICNKKD